METKNIGENGNKPLREIKPIREMRKSINDNLSKDGFNITAEYLYEIIQSLPNLQDRDLMYPLEHIVPLDNQPTHQDMYMLKQQFNVVKALRKISRDRTNRRGA
jgi:hypothetical protein